MKQLVNLITVISLALLPTIHLAAAEEIGTTTGGPLIAAPLEIVPMGQIPAPKVLYGETPPQMTMSA